MQYLPGTGAKKKEKRKVREKAAQNKLQPCGTKWIEVPSTSK